MVWSEQARTMPIPIHDCRVSHYDVVLVATSIPLPLVDRDGVLVPTLEFGPGVFDLDFDGCLASVAIDDCRLRSILVWR